LTIVTVIHAKELPERKEVVLRYPLENVQSTLHHFDYNHSTPENKWVEPHSHDVEEFWFIIKGKAEVEVDGKKYILEDGDMVVTPPGYNHRFNALEGDVWWLCFMGKNPQG